MITKLSSVILPGLVLFASCTGVSSIHPVATDEKDKVFKKELLGKWNYSEDGEILIPFIVDTIKGSGGKTYLLKIIDTTWDLGNKEQQLADTSYFLASLVNLKGKYFIDCAPYLDEYRSIGIGNWTLTGLLNNHKILRVHSVTKDSIIFSSIDSENLQKLIKEKKLFFRHEVMKDQVLIFERSVLLQQKLQELDKFPSVYTEKIFATRMK